MKERSLLYFITAVILSTLVLVSIVIRLFNWFELYGDFAMPTLHKLLIPLVLIWVGWYFENKGFLLSSIIIITLLFGFHLDNYGLINGDIFVPSDYAPLVKTTFVLGILLFLGSIGFGYYTYFKLDQKPE